MKKFLILISFSLLAVPTVYGQQTDGKWTLNTRAYSTNYFTSAIYNAAQGLVKHFAFKGHTQDSLWAERIIPNAELVFPIGMGKRGFKHSGQDIYGPYHYAFGNPFKHIGDYAIGIDASYKLGTLGVYAGAYYKSQEIVFKENKDNLRGFYFQPRFGLIAGVENAFLEAGVFYDAVVGSGGSVADTNKDRLKSGWGLDFSLGYANARKTNRTSLTFSMPLHNFVNPGYAGQGGMKRKVGYLMITHRICL